MLGEYQINLAGALPDKAAERPKTFNYNRPWERQPFDLDDHWLVFWRFLCMSPPRHLEDLANGQPSTVMLYRTWASEFAWHDRARAFDDYIQSEIQRHAQEYMAKQAIPLGEMQAKVLDQGHRVLMTEWQKMLKKSIESHGEAVSPSTLIRMTETLIKLARLLDGQATERIAIQDSDVIDVLDVSELKVLEAAHAKLLAAGKGS